MVAGNKTHAEALLDEVAAVLSTVGLRLSASKTVITHIDEGLVFLGWHIQRRRKPGTDRHYVYTYPSRKAVTRMSRVPWNFGSGPGGLYATSPFPTSICG